MAEHPEHSELHRAFKQSEEDYHNKRLMKPRFEDFKLRFVGPHDQVEDSAPKPSAVSAESIYAKKQPEA